MVVMRSKITGILVLFLSMFSVMVAAQDLEEATVAYNEGVELFGQDQLEAAMEAFLRCVEICDMLEEEESLETKMQVTSVIPGLQFRIAGKILESNDFENGIAALEKTIELSDEYDDAVTKEKAESQLSKAYLVYAKNLLKKENYPEADSYFDKILELDTNNASVFFLKGYMYQQQDMPDKLKENYLKSIEIAKKTNDRRTENNAIGQGYKYFLKKADDAFKSNDFQACINNSKTSLEFDPDQSDALYLILASYNKLEQWDNAIKTGTKALEVENGGDEKKARIYYEMATAYKEKGDTGAACENYRNAMYGPYIENAKYQIEYILKCDS